MKIFLNQNKHNNFNELLQDNAIQQAKLVWGDGMLYERSLIDLRIFQTPFGSISLLYGPRQIGKTATLKLYLSQVKDSGVLIFTDCSVILNRADLYNHLSLLIPSKETNCTIVLDEVQSVEDWHLALRALYGEGKLNHCRVWCTGSEAKYLLESGERLPGRKGEGKTVFARPWSFREYMDFFHPEKVASFKTIDFQTINQNWIKQQSVDWETEWTQYCRSGGFPRPLAELHTKNEISDSTFHIYKDWILGTWSKLRTSEASLISLSRRLTDTLNSRVSMESLKKGTDILSPNTVKTLIDMQEDHFSIHILKRFDIDLDRHLPAKQKKIYPIDPGIARVWGSIGNSITRLCDRTTPPLPLNECAFFTQLLRHDPEIKLGYIYSEKTQSEIDFYFQGCAFELKSRGKPTPNQVKLLKEAPSAFVLNEDQIPIMAYLIGEARIHA